jgi:shikimate dehydrogenase
MEAARRELGPGANIVGVIGSPVGHSLSPLLHNTAFSTLGVGDRWRSYAFDVPAGGAGDALAAMHRFDVTGLSVTMPHKAAVAALVDDLSDDARRLDAVNCVTNVSGRLEGSNTDGAGFVTSLVRGAGFEPAGRRCLVVGAGGAARAVVLALASSGAAEVAVANRTLRRARDAAVLAGPVGRVVALADAAVLTGAVAAADLVVNATPLGMSGRDGADVDDAWAVPPGLLHRGQVVADLVYTPRPTPWLAAAADAGAIALDGLGMLVHQAAAQLVRWTGLEPPVEPMWQAAVEARPAGSPSG